MLTIYLIGWFIVLIYGINKASKFIQQFKTYFNDWDYIEIVWLLIILPLFSWIAIGFWFVYKITELEQENENN